MYMLTFGLFYPINYIKLEMGENMEFAMSGGPAWRTII